MEALARQVPAFTLLRVNPDAAGVPVDLLKAGRAVSIARGNDALAEIVAVLPATNERVGVGAPVAVDCLSAVEPGADLPWPAYFANLNRPPENLKTAGWRLPLH